MQHESSVNLVMLGIQSTNRCQLINKTHIQHAKLDTHLIRVGGRKMGMEISFKIRVEFATAQKACSCILNVKPFV